MLESISGMVNKSILPKMDPEHISISFLLFMRTSFVWFSFLSEIREYNISK